ncbi:MAG: hypothetical protein U0992_22550 [Planctomycetaceae bacterium]
MRYVTCLVVGLACIPLSAADTPDLDPAFFHDGELAGSLRSADPLPLYDVNPQHLWNRLHAAISIRESFLPSKRGGTPIRRIEGGDRIEFLSWPGTTYWDEPESVARIDALLDEFRDQHGEQLVTDPLKHVILQHDLWAVFDSYMKRNIERRGDLEARRRRTELCRRLAHVIQLLALPADTLARLPDNYAIALQSGHFDATHGNDPARNYLPPHLLTDCQEWPELDFHQPQRPRRTLSGDSSFCMLAFRGRSYFRVFYRFPDGRTQLEAYLKDLDEHWVDWKFSALNGYMRLKPDTPQIPAGTEVSLVQFLIAARPGPEPGFTRSSKPSASSSTKRRRRERSHDEHPLRRQRLQVLAETAARLRRTEVRRTGTRAGRPAGLPHLFESEQAVDWGPRGRYFELANDCKLCHAASGLTGVHTIPSLVNSGSSDSASSARHRPHRTGRRPQPTPGAHGQVETER